MTSKLTPRVPIRPLIWPEFVSQLQSVLTGMAAPVYIVGGAVRDAWLHRPLKDLDLATGADAIPLARAIANALKGNFFPLDTERDVGRVLLDRPEGRLLLDVAHFRGPDLLVDLSDRDFTINALAVDLHGDLNQLIDPLDGEGDLVVKRIRRCHAHSLDEDPIRALRAVRQGAQLGFRIESDTLQAVRRVALRLTDISAERVRDEFIRLLALPNAASALRVADALGVLEVIAPEVKPLHGLPQSEPHVFDGWQHTLSVVENLSQILVTLTYQRSDNLTASFSRGMVAIQLDRYRQQLQTQLDTVWPNERPHRALLSLAALLHDVGKPQTAQTDETTGRVRFLGHEQVGANLADERAALLRLSNGERQRLVAIVQNHMRPLLLETPSARAVHRFWRQLGPAGVDVCLLALADYLGARGPELDQDGWLALVERVRLLLEAYYEHHDQLVAPPPLIDGGRLMQAFKLQSGPIIGQLLDLIREGQVAGEIRSTEDALQLAEDYLKRRQSD